jgi:hypothetical protein
LGDRWHPTYCSSDRSHREVAKEVRTSIRKTP